MFEQTDTHHGPWTIINANEKRYARLAAIRAVTNALVEETDPDQLPAKLHMPAL